MVIDPRSQPRTNDLPCSNAENAHKIKIPIPEGPVYSFSFLNGGGPHMRAWSSKLDSSSAPDGSETIPLEKENHWVNGKAERFSSCLAVRGGKICKIIVMDDLFFGGYKLFKELGGSSCQCA